MGWYPALRGVDLGEGHGFGQKAGGLAWSLRGGLYVYKGGLEHCIVLSGLLVLVCLQEWMHVAVL